MFLQTYQTVLRKVITWQTLPRMNEFRDVDGFLSTWEAVILYRLARSLPNGSIVLEIGSWKGKSTYCLARGLRSGRVITIDPFDGNGEPGSAEMYEHERGDSPLIVQFKNRMDALGVLSKIEIREGYSRDFVGTIPRVNLLFIDRDHSIEGCTFDFESYAPILVNRGMIAFHDYDPKRKALGPTWVIENQVLPSSEFQRVGILAHYG